MKHKTWVIALSLAALGTPAMAATSTSFFDWASFWARFNPSTTSTTTSTTKASTTTTKASTTTTAQTSTTTVTSTTTTTASSGAALPSSQTCALSNFQQDLMTRINQFRSSSRVCGSLTYAAAAPLKWNTKLFNAAAGHSADMASKNYFSHTSRDGRTFSQRITAAGYSWNYAGENIAAGQTTVEQVMNAWIKSPGHCANLMNKNFTEVGVACVRNDASTYRTYWTMDLARPY